MAEVSRSNRWEITSLLECGHETTAIYRGYFPEGVKIWCDPCQDEKVVIVNETRVYTRKGE